MKKFFGFLMVALFTISLASCEDKKDKVYKHNGVFKAVEVSTYEGTPQVSWVSVTIEKNEVVKFELDERQSKVVDGEIVWNAKTKKELGPDYGMTMVSDVGEWDEQAAAIEAKWLADGVDSVTFDEAGFIDNMADATMVGDYYNDLANEALKNAKDGLAIDFEVSIYGDVPQITWVEVQLDDKGKVESFYLDERQSTFVDEVFNWNEKTKKELGPDYGMTMVSDVGEWDEQAEAIEAKWLAEGIDAVTFDEAGYIDNMADATMIGDNYNRIAKAALNNVGK